MSDQGTLPESLPAKEKAPSPVDLVTHNPYFHFVVSELYAGLAAVAVYCTSHSAAFAIQFFATQMPLMHAGPTEFLEKTLHWAAALGAGSTFSAVTVYQFVVLMRRLMEDIRK